MPNFYVRTAATGTGDGSDWNNAFTEFANINWVSVRSGDNIWVAGGNYQALPINKGGVAGQPIQILRAISSDAVPVAAPGWSPSFATTQIVINAVGGVGITIGALSSPVRYVTLDGRSAPIGLASAFLVKWGNTGGSGGGEAGVWSGNNPTDHIVLKNISCISIWPGISAQVGDMRGFDITGTPLKSDYSISSCEVGGPHDTSIFFAVNAGVFNNMLIEGCLLHDSGTGNPGVMHPNVISFGECTNVTVRNNRCYNFTVEGIFLNFNTTHAWIYGNCLFGAADWPSSNARAFEVDQAANATDVHIWNNSIYHLPLGARLDNSTGTISGCEFQNNILVGASASFQGGWAHDHNAYDTSNPTGEPGALYNIVPPFKAPNSGDFHFFGANARGINVGRALINPATSPPNGATHSVQLDPDGNTRGGDGLWDMGAYEFLTIPVSGGGGGSGGSGSGQAGAVTPPSKASTPIAKSYVTAYPPPSHSKTHSVKSFIDGWPAPTTPSPRGRCKSYVDGYPPSAQPANS